MTGTVAGRPLGSISLDLDNLWTYLKIRGDSRWVDRPSYLDVFVPHALEVLDRLSLKITFFIVGADAESASNRPALRSIVEAGHEIGNHSYEHEPWLHLYTAEQLRSEISRADAAIERATGRKPAGFRGPGFSWCPELLGILEECGYEYDASTLPTFLGPLARLYYFRTAKLSTAEREQRKELFGRFADGFRPVKPYYWDLPGGKRLLELPVTTMPVFRTPFHFSYLAYLSRFSESLMTVYLHTVIAACGVTGTEPSFLLHPLDIIGGDRLPELEFFPGMDIPSARKTQLLEKVLTILGTRFDWVPMGIHARSIRERGNLRLLPAA